MGYWNLILIFVFGSFIGRANSEFNKFIELANGLPMPRLGLGTAGLRSATTSVVLNALDVGYKMIDTAQAQEWYDEALVGQALAQTSVPISDIVVVTKVHPRSFAEESLRSMVKQSKRLLYSNDSKILDVVLLHSPYCWRNSCTREQESHDWREAWFALEKLKKAGEVAAIGVSNFDENLLNELFEIANVKISVIQNWMDPFNQDVEVRELAQKHNIAYMAYSSYGTQWEWKLKKNPVFTSDIIQSIADKYNTTIARVVTSWVLQLNCIAIPRSSNSDHILDNFVEEPFLDEEDMQVMQGLNGYHGKLWD